MPAFLRLIRLPNLFIIALTMYFVRYFLLAETELEGTEKVVRHINFYLDNLHFFLLVISVMLVAAGGNVINDIQDTESDTINKPEKVIIGKEINEDQALTFYMLLTMTGVLIGFYIGYHMDRFKLGMINGLAAGLLWFYSVTYKRRFLIGNIVIAALSGLIPLLVGIFEPSTLREDDYMNSKFVFIAGYALFAFLLTMIREIVKDVEDMKGDEADGCTTLPVVMGVPFSKIISVSIIFITMLLLGWIQSQQITGDDLISFWYFTLAIQFPLGVLAVLVLKANEKKDFHRSSILTKLVMVSGILSMPVFYLSLLHAA